MTDTQVKKCFYSESEAQVHAGIEGKLFRLPPNTFTGQKKRAEFWAAYRQRQAIWAAAKQALATCEVDVEKFKESPFTKGIASRSNLDAFETQMFGETVTIGSNSTREQFWEFVVLLAHGVTPSDLTQQVNTFQRETEEHLTYFNLPDDVKKKYAQGKTVKSTTFEREICQNKRPLTPLRGWTYRKWANLLLGAGYHESHMCCIEESGAPVTLSMPVDPIAEGVKRNLGNKYLSLSDWRLCCITRLSDILAIVSTKRIKDSSKELAVIPDYGNPAFYSIAIRNYVGKAIITQALEVRANWPASTKELLREMSDRRYCLGILGSLVTVDTSDKLAKLLDANEQELFGKIMTAGLPHYRDLFWRAMQRIFNTDEGLEIPYLSLNLSHYTPYTERIKSSAVGWVSEGWSLKDLARLRDFGRQGVGKPMSKKEIFEKLEPEEIAEYRTLAWWIEYTLY